MDTHGHIICSKYGVYGHAHTCNKYAMYGHTYICTYADMCHEYAVDEHIPIYII